MKFSEKGIIIRETVEDDLRQIYELGMTETELTGAAARFDAENLADIFSSENSICFSAVRKNKILGFISGSVSQNISTMRWIAVKDKFRRWGIGSGLMEFYINESGKRGAKNISIPLLKSDSASVKFFTQRGYTMRENYIELLMTVI